MATDQALLDCPRCASAGSVYRWTCEICEGVAPQARLHPSIPLRFSDVIAELGAIADMASDSGAVDGPPVAAACRRAASLLRVLRRQFVEDLVEPQGNAPRRVERSLPVHLGDLTGSPPLASFASWSAKPKPE